MLVYQPSGVTKQECWSFIHLGQVGRYIGRSISQAAGIGKQVWQIGRYLGWSIYWSNLSARVSMMVCYSPGTGRQVCWLVNELRR